MGIVDTITGKLGGQAQGANSKGGSLLSGVMEMFPTANRADCRG